MIIELQSPFSENWRSGYLRQSKKDKRRRVDLFNSNIDRTTISYAKYMVCIDIGSYLPDGYEVDHIDGDRTNDVISNLQIISKEDHLEKTKKEMTTGRTMIKLVCPNCFNSFEKEKRFVKVGTVSKCSRRCNALFNRKNNGWKRN